MTETPPPPLEALTEDWERMLCVVAHPDDLEFGAAAAIARWTGQGKKVTYCMVTSGEAGIDTMPPEQCGPSARTSRSSGAAVGVEEVEFLGHPDGVLEYGVDLRRVITAVVRLHRPEIVVTGNFRDTWAGENLNQADHIATGRAVLDAVRDAGNRWVFREQIEQDGLEPWGGVRAVWAASSPQSRHGVDVTDTFDAGVASLAAHKAYIEGLGWEDFDPAEFLEGMTRSTGQRMGVTHATAFEVFPMGWGS